MRRAHQMPHYNHFVAFCYVRVEVLHRIKFLRYYLKAPLPLVLGFIAPCVGHCGVSSTGFVATGKRCRMTSSRASNRPSSTSRKVSCTWRPASSRWTFTDAGASGKDAVGGSAGVGAGAAGASPWPLVPAVRVRCIRAVARFCMPAAMRCLHQPEGALGKSLQSHVPLT